MSLSSTINAADLAEQKRRQDACIGGAIFEGAKSAALAGAIAGGLSLALKRASEAYRFKFTTGPRTAVVVMPIFRCVRAFRLCVVAAGACVRVHGYGLHARLAGGPRSCEGWRAAVPQNAEALDSPILTPPPPQNTHHYTNTARSGLSASATSCSAARATRTSGSRSTAYTATRAPKTRWPAQRAAAAAAARRRGRDL